MSEFDDDIPTLPADALAALKEFYSERDARQKQFEDLKSQAENEFDGQKKLSMEAFAEDWNYDDETATTLARQLLDSATDESAIAVISAPSVFIQLKNLLASEDYSIKPTLALLEFDKRFEVFKEFIFYDFGKPTRLPSELHSRFDRIIFDPPFLSEDCQTKAALTARWLARDWTPVSESISGLRLIGCTGERMETLVTKLYVQSGLKTTNFEIKHTKGLSNEFRCYANFECENWKWASTMK